MLALDEDGLEQLRGGVVSMIFQEPMLALDPVYTIGDQIAETVMRHRGASWAEGRKRALEMLESGAHPLGEAAGSRPIRTRCPAACASAP